MEQTHYVVSQEFFQQSNLFKKIDTLNTNLTSFFSRQSSDPIQSQLTTMPNQGKIKKVLGKKNYTDLVNYNVPVPVGINVTYIDYTDVLSECISINEKLVSGVLGPLARWTSLSLADPERLQNLSGVGIVDYAPNPIEEQLAKLEGCFKRNSEHALLPFKQAFERNADVTEAFKKADVVIERFKTLEHTKIKTKTQETVELLGRLIDLVENDDDVVLSSKNNKALEEMIYATAREVEFYGLVAYQVEALSVSLDKIYTFLKNTA